MIRINTKRSDWIEVPVEDIVLIQASDKYVDIYTRDRVYVHTESIKAIFERHSDVFIKPCRGLLVKIDEVKELRKLYLDKTELVLKEPLVNGKINFRISRGVFLPLVERLNSIGRIKAIHSGPVKIFELK